MVAAGRSMGRERPRLEPDRDGRGNGVLSGLWSVLSRANTKTFVGLVVTFVWAVSFIADIFLADYDPDATIHVVMMVVAGGIFGQQIVEKAKNGG